MPLLEGSSKAIISENIRREVRLGHPIEQAVAMALRKAGKRKKRVKGEARLRTDKQIRAKLRARIARLRMSLKGSRDKDTKKWIRLHVLEHAYMNYR